MEAVQIPPQVYQDAPLTSRRNVAAYIDPNLSTFSAQYNTSDQMVFREPPTLAEAAHELTHAYLGGYRKADRGLATVTKRMAEQPSLKGKLAPIAEKLGYDDLKERVAVYQSVDNPQKFKAGLCAVDEGLAFAVGKAYGEKHSPLENAEQIEKRLGDRGIPTATAIDDNIIIDWDRVLANDAPKTGEPARLLMPGYDASCGEIAQQMRGGEDLISQLGIDGARSFTREKMREGYLKGTAPSLPQEAQTLREDRVAFFNSMDSFGGR